MRAAGIAVSLLAVPSGLLVTLESASAGIHRVSYRSSQEHKRFFGTYSSRQTVRIDVKELRHGSVVSISIFQMTSRSKRCLSPGCAASNPLRQRPLPKKW